MKSFREIGELFVNKENRNKRFKELKANGITDIRKSTTRNQQIHPEYIEDFKGEFEIGFGNSDYQTFFSVLYKIEKAW